MRTSAHVHHEIISTSSEPTHAGYVLAARLINWVLGIVEAILALRLVLVLLGANRTNVFAQFVFNLSHPLAQPFFTLFNYQPSYGVSRLELGTIVAMIVYAVVASALIGLLHVPHDVAED